MFSYSFKIFKSHEYQMFFISHGFENKKFIFNALIKMRKTVILNIRIIFINFFSIFRDGRFRLGDEIINVNGKSLRGLTMDEAKSLLKTCGPEVDIILARDPDQQIIQPDQPMPNTNSGPISNNPANSQNPSNFSNPSNLTPSSAASGMGPVERRRRRKLPPIERPRSAPIHNMFPPSPPSSQGGGPPSNPEDNGSGLRTVIKIGTNSQSIEHHHHHIHHLGKLMSLIT